MPKNSTSSLPKRKNTSTEASVLPKRGHRDNAVNELSAYSLEDLEKRIKEFNLFKNEKYSNFKYVFELAEKIQRCKVHSR